MQDIGKNIRTLRTQKGMTQDELAEKLFVSRQTVSNYETGRSKPDVDMLMRIAEVLGVEVQHLLYGSPDTNQRLSEKRSLMLACFMTAAAAVLYWVARQADQHLRQEYLITLGIANFLLLCPVLFLLLGRTATQGVALALNARRPLKSWLRYVHWAVWAVILFYFFMTLPFSVWCLQGAWAHWIATPAGGNFHSSESFALNFVTAFMVRHNQFIPAIFVPLGGLLWITGGRCKTSASENPSSADNCDQT